MGIQSTCQLAGFQQEFTYEDGSVTVDSVTAGPMSAQVDLYYSAKGGRLCIGLVDIQGQVSIPAGSGELVTVHYHTLVTDVAVTLPQHSFTKAVDEQARPAEMTVNLAKGVDLLPKQFALFQNYPNPFNSGTVINYDLPVKARVRIEVFNILGQRVTTLTDGEQPAGHHRVMWDGTSSQGKAVASGVYFYKIQANDFSTTKKMMLLK